RSPHARRLLAHKDAYMQERARSMRFTPTDSEARLWLRLQGRQLGVRFVRQVVIDRYIADFAAPSRRLIVEVDGGYHVLRAQADARREAALVRKGWRVLRVTNDAILRDIDAAVARIRAALAR